MEMEPPMLAPNAFVRNRYLIVRQIGAGPAGAVYEALDMQNHMHVALKQISGAAVAGAPQAERFQSLHHSALPPLTDSFAEDHDVFLAMEYIHGDDLATLLEQKGMPFPIVQVLRWADQLLDALSYLHSQRPPAFHGDIKPQNLKLTPRGQIMLLDLGVPHMASSQSKLLGSKNISALQFTAPEHVQGTPMSAHGEIYALAATLYYLLTGTLPPLAGRRANAIARGQDDPLPPPHDLNAQVPGQISTVLMRALALDPEWRYESADAMRSALSRARVAGNVPLQTTERQRRVAPPVAPLPPTIPTPSVRPAAPTAPVKGPAQSPQLRRIVPVAAVVLVLIGALLAFLLLRRPGGAADAPQPTQAPAATSALAALATQAPAATSALAALATQAPAATSAPAPTEPAAAVLPVATRPAGPGLQITPRPTAPPQATATPAVLVAGVVPPAAFTGVLPLVFTVSGTNLDQVRAARLVSPGGPAIDTAIQPGAAGQITLNVAALPAPINGEASYRMELNGTLLEAPAITLRDFLDRRQLQGILPQYDYTNRVGADAGGAYTAMRAEPNAAGQAIGRLRNGDMVDVLRNDVPDWYQLRVSASADAAQIGATGWLERWLVDNQGVPAAPVATPAPQQLVFAGRVYSTPTDAAVQCGSAFESSIFGSVENSAGRGIAGARVRITSADRRNTYNVTTGRGGVYTLPGLGCTTWTVRLISVPNAPGGIQAGPVTVRNLNGGRYTSAEVRFKQQK
jgi:hypothetical protein